MNLYEIAKHEFYIQFADPLFVIRQPYKTMSYFEYAATAKRKQFLY